MSDSSQLSLRWQKAQIIGNFSGGLLIPIVILIAGAWLTHQQGMIADERQNSDRVAQLLQHLGSIQPRERILAIEALRYHQTAHALPDQIVGALIAVAASDDVTVAAAASAVLGADKKSEIERKRVLLELLGPMMIHLDRTKDYFEVWSPRNTVLATSVIHDSNKAVRNLLMSHAELIPLDLVDDAIALVEHYDAWFVEYERVRRARDTPYVFVGPTGKPFPRESEARFRARYAELLSGTGSASHR
jgi:hypothetical protein